MGALDFTQKYWWKNFIHKLYSWGASIVLVGALFKITHWPGATIMLTVGLLTEAVIFFFSGIEPPHEEIDWTLVYPELKVSEEGEDILSSGKGTSRRGGGAGVELPATSLESIAKFDEMLEKAGQDGLFDKLNQGLNKLNDNVVKLNDITDASVATNEFAENIKSASQKVSTLSETYEKSANEFSSVANELNSAVKNSSQTITYSVDNLSDSFNKTAETVTNHKQELDNAYTNLVGSMDIDFKAIAEGNSEYNEKIGMLNKNLSAINAIFEMRLEDANLDQMVKDIQESATYAKKYSDEINKLSRNLAALNDVYGKMLTAMNVQVD